MGTQPTPPARLWRVPMEEQSRIQAVPRTPRALR